MKKRITSIVIVLTLAVSMITTNAFVVNTKAVSRDEILDSIVDGIKKDTEEYHRTHIKGKNGSRTIIDNNYKKVKKAKKGRRFPDSYVAPYTSVKDQNVFSSCWMFGETASLESNLMLKAGYGQGKASTDPIDLSEAQGLYVQYNRQTREGTMSGTILPDSDNDKETNSDRYYGFDEGGWPLDASMAITANKGAALESDNPYIARSSSTMRDDARTMGGVAAANYRLNRFDIKSAEQLPEVYAVTGSGLSRTRVYDPSVRDIWKSKIIGSGAISGNYWQTTDAKYHHGWGLDESEYERFPNFWVFDANTKSKFDTNHVITIVGYDDNYSKYNFMAKNSNYAFDAMTGEEVYIKIDPMGEPVVEFDAKGHLVSIDKSETLEEGYASFIVPKEDGAWYIKNSYGTEASSKKTYDNGIMYASYCEPTLSETVASDTLESLDQIQNNEKIYDTTLSHSSLSGEVSQSTFSEGDKAAEVYTIDPDKDFELGQVGYWTYDEGVTTRVKVYNELVDAASPESGTLVYDSSDVTDAYEGYHTISLDDKVLLTHGSNASIVISQTCDGDSSLMIEFDYKDAGNAGYVFNHNAGDTFFYTRNEWFTQEEVDAKAQKQGYTVGNSTVKMFGNLKEVPVPKYTVTVDGVETEVTQGDDFTFPTASANGYANADYSTLYAPGQTVEVQENITATSIGNIDFTMEPGASVDLRGNDGLRFCAEASYADDDFLNSDNVEFGTLITPVDIFIGTLDEELDLDKYEEFGDSKIAKIVNSGWRLGNVGSFAAGIIHLKEYNWHRSFVANSYMIIKYSNGSNKVLYTGLSDERSLVQVVENLRDAGYPGLTQDQIAMLQKYLNED